MKIKTAQKLLEKHDLMFQDGLRGSRITIIEKDQNYYCPWANWCKRISNEDELKRFLIEHGKWIVWFSRKDYWPLWLEEKVA